MTITGQYFRTGVSVLIGGNACVVGAVSGTAITCTVPAGTVGPATITVTNTDGATAALTDGYRYLLRDAAPVAPGSAVPNPALPARAAAPTAFAPNAPAIPNPVPARRP